VKKSECRGKIIYSYIKMEKMRPAETILEMAEGKDRGE
jgi:hypothetical protein